MKKYSRLVEEFRRNAIAVISLSVAMLGVSYTTWRNETTEHHRNTREAAFRTLQEVGEFQQLVDQRFYGGEKSEVSRIAAWGRVVLIRDMAFLVSEESEEKASELFAIWQVNIEALDQGGQEAEKRISDAASGVRKQVLLDLSELR